MPMPWSRHRRRTTPSPSRDAPTPHLAAVGRELDGVRDQVRDHLADAVGVGADAAAARPRRSRRSRARSLCRREQATVSRSERAEVECGSKRRSDRPTPCAADRGSRRSDATSAAPRRGRSEELAAAARAGTRGAASARRSRAGSRAACAARGSRSRPGRPSAPRRAFARVMSNWTPMKLTTSPALSRTGVIESRFQNGLPSFR